MNVRKSFLLLAALFVSASSLWAIETGSTSRDEYIKKWKDEAIYQMTVHKIPASITLAQGILESGNGNSTLAKKANNHFGIKCHSTWDGEKVYHDDDAKGECFRKYPNAQQSFEDHSIFLKQRRYQGLYHYDLKDYKAWAKGLKKAGYATDPKYAKRLIDLIEENNLDKYDKEGIKLMKKGETPERNIESDPKEEDIFVNKPNRPNVKGDESDTELPEIALKSHRSIKNSKNNIPYIMTSEGDTFDKIAHDLELMPWQLWKYNDLNKTDKLSAGQKLYIKPKRSKAKAEYHVVTEGQTPWEISQLHGIKLRKLCMKNGINYNSVLAPGTKLYLRKKAV